VQLTGVGRSEIGAPAGGRTLNYSPESTNLSKKSTTRGWSLVVLAGCALVFWGMVTLLESTRNEETARDAGGPEEPALTHTLAGQEQGLTGLPLLRSDSRRTPDSDELGPLFRLDEGPVEMRIDRGQTFYEAIAAQGAPHTDIMALVRDCKSFRNLTKVQAGEIFRVHIRSDGGLASLGFDMDEESHVTWVREGDTYVRVDGTYPVQYRLKGVSGTIESSLYTSLQKLDAPLSLAPKMNDILGWDIDFSRDLRQGDTFRILYDEVWKDEERVRTGSIQSLEIVNRGEVKRAYRFSTPDGRPSYYDPTGKNMQKQLMRAPLEYSRISSNFSYRRFHPILKRYMPHMGVDYAAPLGTPVRAGGDGTVVVTTHKKGNGRYVHIKHTNREYETYYLHLSRYAKGIKSGKRVTQGQIIGYVGASGYATGPHLDYRVKRNGKWVNPRTLKLPAAAPVSDVLRSSFESRTGILTATMLDLPADSTVPVPPLMLIDPPAWDGTAFAMAEIPAVVRAQH